MSANSSKGEVADGGMDPPARVDSRLSHVAFSSTVSIQRSCLVEPERELHPSSMNSQGFISSSNEYP
jgi:hypothetical protein